VLSLAFDAKMLLDKSLAFESEIKAKSGGVTFSLNPSSSPAPVNNSSSNDKSTKAKSGDKHALVNKI